MAETFYVLQNAETFDSVYITRVRGGHAAIIAEIKATQHGDFNSVDLAEMLRTVLNSKTG